MSRLSAAAALVAAVCLAFAPSPTRAAECAGDCDDSGQVTIAELVTLVDMALRGAGTTRCPNGDLDRDGAIAINELVSAVSAALRGCPATPTVTVTTPRENTATPTDSLPPASPTATIEGSPTAQPSATEAASPTGTSAVDATPTATSAANSPSATSTVEPSATETASPGQTATNTISRTATASVTGTVPASPTVTCTAQNSPTLSASATATISSSPSASATFSATATASGTRTVSRTATASATAVASATRSSTATATTFITATRSSTPTRTATQTNTASPLATATRTTTGTRTATATRTGTATRTATGTRTPTATVTPTPGLGVRRFSLNPQSSLIRLLPDPGTATGFSGYLDLAAGAPDPVSGLATVDIVGASEFLSVEVAGITLCIKPTVPVVRAGVLACNGGVDLGVSSSQDHRIGQVGVNGFTANDCTAAGGTLEGGGDPHPGVCNGPVDIGPSPELDSGIGALLIAPDDRFDTQGLPADVTIEEGPCDEHGPGEPTLFGFVSGISRASIPNANNVTGMLFQHDEDGENFSCPMWKQENGPGRLVLSVPAVHGLVSGDLITVFVLDD